MVLDDKLKALTVTEFNLLANKDPRGSYDRLTRENLNSIIRKLTDQRAQHSSLEHKLFIKFKDANFYALEDKAKKIRFELVRYRLSSNVKKSIKFTSSVLGLLIVSGFIIYQGFLGAESKNKVDVAYYAGLNQVGLVSKEGLDTIKQSLKKTSKENEQLNQMVEQMIHNNKITENLKYILKQIYENPKTKYLQIGKQNIINYGGDEIARYTRDPALWYVLGVVEQGIMRIYYADEEILQIRAIFGRKGEETPIGNYEIKNRVYKPTWYKKEPTNGRIRVRAIPFGDTDHEIGHWWLGLKKLDNVIPGSYGIHGVNASKVNEFYKKNFDWRNGSAGCPNIQEWYLHFLGKVLPLGTKVNIVSKDKWNNSLDVSQTVSPT
ncbi:MAG: L,D-transpeptidase [Nitrospinaceae bacterium]